MVFNDFMVRVLPETIFYGCLASRSTILVMVYLSLKEELPTHIYKGNEIDVLADQTPSIDR